MVDAKLYAGAIDADDSTEISKNRRTRGKCFLGVMVTPTCHGDPKMSW
jgi:hypothetical protein